jgi:GTP cyclohydrolase II
VFLTGFDRASRQITVYQRTEGQMSDLVDKITGKTKQAVGDVVKANEVANLERETH